MTNKLTTYFAGLGIFVSALVSLIAMSPSVSAVVDNDPDCDSVAIIRCGAFSADVMRTKASQGDVPRVYNAFNISQDDLRGNYVDGIVWRDGRVTVGGKTVATGAMTAGRNFGGTPIAGTNAGKYPTSRFATEGQTAFVRMVDGKFDFAIIKACGNPVTATPNTPPAPEQPKEIKVCVLATWEIKTIKESDFDKNKYTKDLEKCQPIKVCELKTFTIITIKQGEFDSRKHSKDLDKCRNIKVCELATHNIITIKRGEFDSRKHSKDLNDCKEVTTPNMIKVCELSTKHIIEIKESDFDGAKHSKDLNRCQVEDTPQVLASTGPETAVMSLFGSSALGYGAFSYLQSRRHLLSKLLGR